jgi:hypothetical protein
MSTAALVAGLGDRKDQATRGEKKKMIAAKAELKSVQTQVCSCSCAGMGYVLSVTWLSNSLGAVQIRAGSRRPEY